MKSSVCLEPFRPDAPVTLAGSSVGSVRQHNAIADTTVCWAPTAVYTRERYGNYCITNKFTGLVPNATYRFELHSSENNGNFSTVGKRDFNLFLQNVQVLTNFDEIVASGYMTPYVRAFETQANANGEIIASFTKAHYDVPHYCGVGPLRHERAVRREELHRQPPGQRLSLHLVEVHGRAALPCRRPPRRLGGLAAARDRLRGRDVMRRTGPRLLDRLGGAPHGVERRGRGVGGADRRLGLPRLHVQLRRGAEVHRDVLSGGHAARRREPRRAARSDHDHLLRQADALRAAQPARGQDVRAADLAQRELRNLHKRKRPHLVRHLQRNSLAGQYRLFHPQRRDPQAGHPVFPRTRAERAEPDRRGPCRQQGQRLAPGDRPLRGVEQRHPARAGRRGDGGGRHARTCHVREAPLRHRRPPLHRPPQGGGRRRLDGGDIGDGYPQPHRRRPGRDGGLRLLRAGGERHGGLGLVALAGAVHHARLLQGTSHGSHVHGHHLGRTAW